MFDFSAHKTPDYSLTNPEKLASFPPKEDLLKKCAECYSSFNNSGRAALTNTAFPQRFPHDLWVWSTCPVLT